MAQQLDKPAHAPARPRLAPGPRGGGPLGLLPDLQRDPLGMLLRLRQEHGDVVRHRIALFRSHLVAHPDGVKRILQDNARNYRKAAPGFAMVRRVFGDGLLTSEGDFWLRQRRLAQPAFHRQRLAAFADLISAAAVRRVSAWGAPAAAGRPVDVADEMMALTLAVVSAALLGGDIGPRTAAVHGAFGELNAQLAHRVRALNMLPPVLPTAADRRFRAARAQLDAVVYAIIAERRRAGAGDDLLGMLMAARDEATGESMSDRQLRDEVLTILLAGHETTATALTWALSLVARHPAVEERLRAELDAVLAGRPPALADLPRLSYTRMVFDEAMRLYPPIPVITRRVEQDDEVGGYHIPAGSTVVVSQYVTHRHPALWDEPERFMPERFAPEAEAGRPRYAYFPFGGGPRQCIGNSFALMEGQIILAAVLQRFRLRLPPGHAVEPEVLLTLRPRGGLPMLAAPA